MVERVTDLLLGLLLGIVVIVVFWILFAYVAERSKVQGGYLTYKNKVYKVELIKDTAKEMDELKKSLKPEK